MGVPRCACMPGRHAQAHLCPDALMLTTFSSRKSLQCRACCDSHCYEHSTVTEDMPFIRCRMANRALNGRLVWRAEPQATCVLSLDHQGAPKLIDGEGGGGARKQQGNLTQVSKTFMQ